MIYVQTVVLIHLHFDQALSQHHKRLHSLADHVPHGYRKKSLFEVLVKNNVPLLRATWFIKVTYLNQVQMLLTDIPLCRGSFIF